MISPFWFYIHHISIYGFLPWMLNKSTEAALPRDPRHGLHVQPAAGEGHENGTGCRRGPLRSWRLKSPRYCPGKRNFGNGNLNCTHRHMCNTHTETLYLFMHTHTLYMWICPRTHAYKRCKMVKTYIGSLKAQASSKRGGRGGVAPHQLSHGVNFWAILPNDEVPHSVACCVPMPLPSDLHLD